MTQLSFKLVKIRKPHKCWGCTKEFSIGTKMKHSVSVDNGDFSAAYWCNECEKILGSLEPWQLEDGFLFGELREFTNARD